MSNIASLSSVLAKEADGTIQITFTIPHDLVKKTKDEVTTELAKDVEIPGFRRGKAPVEKAKEKISENALLEKTLNQILPRALADAIAKHKIKPVIYPKFELIKAKDGEDWEVRATTCELPEIELGDYKKIIRGELASRSIKRQLSKEEKDQEVIKALLGLAKVNIPKVLIEEEVNARLSNLLERIEKLGLSLETYLSSIGKSGESLRAEYEKQAKDTIVLELTLNKISQSENIKVEEAKIDEAIKVSSLNDTPEQRRVVRGALARRAVIDSLAGLV